MPAKGGIAWNKGMKISEETRKKMSEAKMGHLVSEETKRKIGEKNKGNKSRRGMHNTEESKKNLSRIMMGNTICLGKIHSKETRKKISEATKGRIPWNKGRKGLYNTSEETKKKIALIHIGNKYNQNREPWNKGLTAKDDARILSREKTGNWKGGKSSLTRRIRCSFKYRQWRSDVFTRDDFTCQDCDKRGGDLEAHHIKTCIDILELNDVKTFDQAMKCEELWNINNGKTLCLKCHNLTKMKDYKESIDDYDG